MKILYFDCFAGISGDMTLGAFIDLGLSLDFLRTELKKLPFADFQIELEEVRKGGLLGKKVNVIQGSGPEEERSYQEIQQGILESNLSDGVKTLSLRFFRKLAEVEARIHGDRLEEVTFHEIGAIDSIVDLVGCAIALEYFQPEQVLASELPVGRGFVEASHSRLPLPAPATLEILKGVPVVPHRDPHDQRTDTLRGDHHDHHVLSVLPARADPDQRGAGDLLHDPGSAHLLSGVLVPQVRVRVCRQRHPLCDGSHYHDSEHEADQP